MTGLDLRAFDGYPISDMGKDSVKRSIEEVLDNPDPVERLTGLILLANTAAETVEGFDGTPGDVYQEDRYKVLWQGVRVAVRTMIYAEELAVETITEALTHRAIATGLNSRAMIEGAALTGADIAALNSRGGGDNV